MNDKFVKVWGFHYRLVNAKDCKMKLTGAMWFKHGGQQMNIRIRDLELTVWCSYFSGLRLMCGWWEKNEFKVCLSCFFERNEESWSDVHR